MKNEKYRELNRRKLYFQVSGFFKNLIRINEVCRIPGVATAAGAEANAKSRGSIIYGYR